MLCLWQIDRNDITCVWCRILKPLHRNFPLNNEVELMVVGIPYNRRNEHWSGSYLRFYHPKNLWLLPKYLHKMKSIIVQFLIEKGSYYFSWLKLEGVWVGVNMFNGQSCTQFRVDRFVILAFRQANRADRWENNVYRASNNTITSKCKREVNCIVKIKKIHSQF